VIVNAVRSGAISLEEVCRRYNLSVEEFQAWQRAIETHGVAGLRVPDCRYTVTPPSSAGKTTLLRIDRRVRAAADKRLGARNRLGRDGAA
jgi:hypothetical protein